MSKQKDKNEKTIYRLLKETFHTKKASNSHSRIWHLCSVIQSFKNKAYNKIYMQFKTESDFDNEIHENEFLLLNASENDIQKKNDDSCKSINIKENQNSENDKKISASSSIQYLTIPTPPPCIFSSKSTSNIFNLISRSATLKGFSKIEGVAKSEQSENFPQTFEFNSAKEKNPQVFSPKYNLPSSVVNYNNNMILNENLYIPDRSINRRGVIKMRNKLFNYKSFPRQNMGNFHHNCAKRNINHYNSVSFKPTKSISSKAAVEACSKKSKIFNVSNSMDTSFDDVLRNYSTYSRMLNLPEPTISVYPSSIKPPVDSKNNEENVYNYYKDDRKNEELEEEKNENKLPNLWYYEELTDAAIHSEVLSIFKSAINNVV